MGENFGTNDYLNDPISGFRADALLHSASAQPENQQVEPAHGRNPHPDQMFLQDSPFPAERGTQSQRLPQLEPICPAPTPAPADLHSPDWPFPGARQTLHDQRQAVFKYESRLWDVFETFASIGAGTWAATKFGPEYAIPVPALHLSPYDKEILRARAVSAAFGATVCSSIAGAVIDHVIAPQDMKMECTVATDWLVQPAISILPIPWKPKVCIMLGSHEIARLIDHYRQPKQSF
jgi:hypothetical protein